MFTVIGVPVGKEGVSGSRPSRPQPSASRMVVQRVRAPREGREGTPGPGINNVRGAAGG